MLSPARAFYSFCMDKELSWLVERKAVFGQTGVDVYAQVLH